MTVDRFPGNFRVGFLNEKMDGTEETGDIALFPKLQLLVLLQGEQEFYLDDEKVTLVASPNGEYSPIACMMNVNKPCRLQFINSYGDPYKKVSIAAPRDWLNNFSTQEDSDEINPTANDQNYDLKIWRPTPEICKLGEQIILPPPNEDEQQSGLFRMSRALEILRRSITQTNEETTIEQSTQAQAQRAIQEDIRLYILANLDKELSIQTLEAHFNLGKRSIQRQFKLEYGMTIGKFIQIERLKLANEELQKNNVTISQAAYIAGYSHACNFSTAFRRQFGVAPKQLRTNLS